MKFGSANQMTYGVTPAVSVSVGERLVFIKKVYGLLSLSLVTAAIGAHLSSSEDLLLYQVAAVPPILFFVMIIGLVFFAQFAAKKPGLNMVALFSFTTVTGLMIGPMIWRVSQIGPTIVAEAITLTALTFVGLTLYVIFSKKDFSFMQGFLFTGLMIVLIGSLINMFFGSSMAQFIISGACVLLFSGFILYDTSNILRNYGTDEYVSATLALYLDILNLFIALLSILGIARSE